MHVQLDHFVEHLDFLWFCGYKYLDYNLYFFIGFEVFPSLKTINPKIVPKQNMNAH